MLPQPQVHPRVDWAGVTHQAKGKLRREEDPRFLLIHHSESPTPTKPAQVPDQIRSFFEFHTGKKGWPDVAYNFFVDPFGGLWEGRTGSLAAAVRGDATGGSQGYAQLCCFIGSYDDVPPSSLALEAAASLLAWLAQRDQIDLTAASRVTFISRGSNRWPKGARVTTATLAGHREMSQTSCPGDALFPLVSRVLRPKAEALLAAASSAGASLEPTQTANPEPQPSPVGPMTPAQPADYGLPLGVGLGVAALVGIGSWYVNRRRPRPDAESQ